MQEKEQIPLQYFGMYQLVVNIVVAHPLATRAVLQDPVPRR